MRARPQRIADACLITFAVVAVGLVLGEAWPRPPQTEVLLANASVGPRERSLDPIILDAPHASPQPVRTRPYRVAATAGKAYVTLAGKEARPESTVAVVDLELGRVRARVPVGRMPYAIAPHPSGRWMLVTNRLSNWMSVIDVATDRVVSTIEVPHYCDDVVISRDGRTAFVSNFAADQVVIVDLDPSGDVLTGRLRELGFDREAFCGDNSDDLDVQHRCGVCGWQSRDGDRCARCGHAPLERITTRNPGCGTGGIHGILRARCGNAACHLHRTGGYVAGPDVEQALARAAPHSWPAAPAESPLLAGVREDPKRPHPGGVVFQDIEHDVEYRALLDWIASGTAGPGIPVGDKPRDLALSEDEQTLYVANTGSLNVSVIDLKSMRPTGRIFTRSPVNDLVVHDGWLLLATLGAGSGHPKAHHEGRESTDRDHPEAEFTLFRDLETGKPLPLSQQRPLGPYDDIDGTLQQKFRDITNDLVILDPKGADDVSTYRATDTFTRYTSDTFEAMAGDLRGDVPAALMRVVGAFPEQIAQRGDRIYVTMSGTFQVQEWRVEPSAPAQARLQPMRVFETGFKPTGITITGDRLLVADHLADTMTVIDLGDGRSQTIDLGHGEPAFPATDLERGEFFVQTSVLSIDQDQSCVHCHYRDTSDGKRWSVSQVMGQSRDGQERTGGSREVPDLRNLVAEVPFFLEGILSIDEPLTMMMEQNPLIDFSRPGPAGDFSTDKTGPSHDTRGTFPISAGGKTAVSTTVLAARRERFFRETTTRYLNEPFGFRDFQRFIGVYQRDESRLLPNPADPDDPMIAYGRQLFESPAVACTSCHPAPTFTDKIHPPNENRAFPPLVSTVARDNIHTLFSADRVDALSGYVRPWDANDKGRIESREGFYVAPSLRGLWARPPRLLHHGRALSVREVLASPGHPALRKLPFDRPDARRPGDRELGLNELDGVPDTHGVTSHLSIWELECLLRFVLSIS